MGAEVEVDRLRSSIVSLHRRISDLVMTSSKAHTDAARARQRAAKASTTSTASSKLREAARQEKKALDAERRRADLERQLATKMKALASAEARLNKERSSQLKTLDALERRVRPLERQFRPAAPPGPGLTPDETPAHDVFISYAAEDREEIARPLAELLRGTGLEVWFDDFSLTVGDSLRQSIDRGLNGSSFGVVILSPDFFRKGWAQSELDGLVARERAYGHKVVLPIWHRLTKDDVLAASPSLADKVALNSSVMTLEEIASAIESVVRPTVDPITNEPAVQLQEQIEHNIDQVRAAVARHGGTAVAVFGSVARGDAHSDSDVDFLVDFEDGRTLADLSALRSELQAIFAREVDVISVGGLRSRDEEIPRDAVWL